MNEWERIARECGTDKGIHTYMPLYERLLGRMSGNPVKILELGIDHGNSLRFWLKMFPLAEVHGLDLFGCDEISDPRLTIHTRFAQDPGISFLWPPGYFDFIVDDAGHEAPWQRMSREILWPNLKTGGLYFIEDILTDAYPEEFDHWGRDPEYLEGEKNCCNANEAYDRADCIVVLKKNFEHASSINTYRCISDPKWPDFFRYMEEQADPPLTGKFSKCPGFFWGWMNYPLLWVPMWEAFKGREP